MVQFFQEIQEQPQALLQTANFYKSVEGKSVLSQISELWCSGKYRKNSVNRYGQFLLHR